jgi:hypothetical protein
MTRIGFRARALGVALGCSALMVAGSASTAGATTAPSHTATIRGTATDLPPDGSCPANPDFPTDPGYRVLITGWAKTRVGPAKVTVPLCLVFVGALGGEEVDGTFSISTLAGRLRGIADGTVGFDATDDYHVTLTVQQAGFLLTGVRGTIALSASASRDDGSFIGTLTSNLHRDHWGHSSAMMFS